MKLSYFLILLLSSCASVPNRKCANIRWEQLASDDVWAGGKRTHFEQAAELCRKANRTPDAPSYELGKSKALLKFCMPDNGFEWGRSGRQNFNACPAPLAEGFNRSYQSGLRAFHEAVASTRASGDYSYKRLSEERDERLNEEEKRKRDLGKGPVDTISPVTSSDGRIQNKPLPSVFDPLR